MMEPEINYEVQCETKINRKEFDMSPAFADKKDSRYISPTDKKALELEEIRLRVKNTWIFMLRNLIKMATQQM